MQYNVIETQKVLFTEFLLFKICGKKAAGVVAGDQTGQDKAYRALTCSFDEDFLATGNGSRRVITANKFNRVHHA